MSNLILFQLERPVFLREQAEMMYHFIPYYISKMIIDIVFIIPTALLFTFIVFFGIGLVISFMSFIKFYFVVALISFAAGGCGTLFSILFTSPETAVLITPVFILPLGVLGGFISNSGSLLIWISWI